MSSNMSIPASSRQQGYPSATISSQINDQCDHLAARLRNLHITWTLVDERWDRLVTHFAPQMRPDLEVRLRTISQATLRQIEGIHLFEQPVRVHPAALNAISYNQAEHGRIRRGQRPEQDIQHRVIFDRTSERRERNWRRRMRRQQRPGLQVVHDLYGQIEELDSSGRGDLEELRARQNELEIACRGQERRHRRSNAAPYFLYDDPEYDTDDDEVWQTQHLSRDQSRIQRRSGPRHVYEAEIVFRVGSQHH